MIRFFGLVSRGMSARQRSTCDRHPERGVCLTRLPVALYRAVMA